MIITETRMYLKFGTGNIQLSTGRNNITHNYALAFKELAEPYEIVPNDPTKDGLGNGYVCFMEFSTVESLDKVMNALSAIRNAMVKESEGERT